MRAIAAAVLLALVLPEPARPLTKTPRRAVDIEREGAWNAASSPCSIRYYNYCSGWVWTWGDLSPETRLGVGHGPTQICTDYGYGVAGQWILTLSAAPSGYGYTGTISLDVADSEYCPTTHLASRPFLPIHGWTYVAWNWGVWPPRHFTTILTTSATPGDPSLFVTDAPSVAPCRPTLNRTHSFLYGTKDDPECPGTPFQDGAFHAELLWDVGGNLYDTGEQPVSVEASTWGRLKVMYR